MEILRKLKKSVFLKLLAVILLVGVLIHISMGILIRELQPKGSRGFLFGILSHLSNYIVDDIGVPPNRMKAMHLSQMLGVEIRFESPEGAWSTADNLPTFHQMRENRKRHHMRRTHILFGDPKRMRFFDRRPPGPPPEEVSEEEHKEYEERRREHRQERQEYRESRQEHRKGRQEFRWRRHHRGPMMISENEKWDEEARQRFNKRNFRIIYDGNNLALLVKRGDARFLLFPKYKFIPPLREDILIYQAIILALLLFGSWFLIRWILRPIFWLLLGVQEVGDGNLKHRVPERKWDELGDLAGAFNNMTGRVGTMIQNRDQLLLDVSHELRSPLTRIKVALEFIDDEEIKSSITEDIDMMESMITEILESERLGSNFGGLDIESTDLIQLIQTIAAQQEGKLPGILMSNMPETLLLNIDPKRVKTVLKNIVENALKYSPDSGEAIEISIREKSQQVVVAVQDHGMGIPESELNLIFEPFYRTDKSRSRETGGYGLGLSLCKKIMELHKGKIHIISPEGQGTRVELTFPKE